MTLQRDYLFFLRPHQKMGWVAIHDKMEKSLRNTWRDSNLHSLKFESEIKGSFYVGNSVFHFKINALYITFSLVTHSIEDHQKLSEEFKSTWDLLFT